MDNAEWVWLHPPLRLDGSESKGTFISTRLVSAAATTVPEWVFFWFFLVGNFLNTFLRPNPPRLISADLTRHDWSNLRWENPFISAAGRDECEA